MVVLTSSVLKISLPPTGVNIKLYGATKAIKDYFSLYSGSTKSRVIYCYFLALHGSALIIHQLAAEFPDIEFVVFVLDSSFKFVKPFMVGLPSNVKVYLANIYKQGNKLVYGKMTVSLVGKPNSKKIVEYVDHSVDHEIARYKSLCDFHRGNKDIISMKFGFAFDHPLFRVAMVDYFVKEFTGVDFSDIHYVRVVAGSGLMSLLLAQALKKLGIEDITFRLIQVGRHIYTSKHEKYYPTAVIKCPIGYNVPFDYNTMSGPELHVLANLPYGYDTYCGKVFIEGIVRRTMFVIIRNGV